MLGGSALAHYRRGSRGVGSTAGSGVSLQPEFWVDSAKLGSATLKDSFILFRMQLSDGKYAPL